MAIPAIRYDPAETLPDLAWPASPARWVSAVAYPLRDADGTVREVVLVHEDITARHRAEEAARFLADAGSALAALVDPRAPCSRSPGWPCRPSPTGARWT